MVEPFQKMVQWFLKKLNKELPYEPAILLLCIQAREVEAYVHPKTCIFSFYHNDLYLVALFLIAKKWKQPKCPSTEEWINMLSTHTMEKYSVRERNEKFDTYYNSDVALKHYVSEINQSKHHILYYSTYMKYLEQANSQKEAEQQLPEAGRRRIQGMIAEEHRAQCLR